MPLGAEGCVSHTDGCENTGINLNTDDRNTEHDNRDDRNLDFYEKKIEVLYIILNDTWII